MTEHLAQDPHARVLFCSHTRAAAQEAVYRYGDSAYISRVDIQTLHAVCFKKLNLSRAQVVTEDRLREFGEEFGIDMGASGLGKEFLDVLNFSRARLFLPEEGYEQSTRPGTPSMFMAFWESYKQWKSVYGYQDFNDMLFNGAEQLESSDFEYSKLVVDEGQDLTALHWRVVWRFMKVRPDSQVIVAADDDQALFAFAGAEALGMRDWARVSGAEIRILSQSYRIPGPVHKLAQAIIERVLDRVPKEYAPRNCSDGSVAQGEFDVWPHLDHMQISRTRDSLVLYADRFVRSEIEPHLQNEGYSYRALNGFPAPLETRPGRALRVVAQNSSKDIMENEDLRDTIRAGLSSAGMQVWDRIGAYVLVERLRKFDWEMLARTHFSVRYYLSHVDLTLKPNIRISTMHGAKGMEADDVHVVLSLSQRAWEEAAAQPDHIHRLLYTAVTRARENLYLYDGEGGYPLPEAFK